VDRFDQMGEIDETDAGEHGQGLPDGMDPGAGAASMMMEQWLQQIEGDPAYLLRNQFEVEERRVMRERPGTLYEPRPW